MEGKLKFHNAIGFSLFHVAEAVMYQFVNTYLLLYLTSVVLMDSDKAGMLVSIGMVFEFASSLIIGKLSDSCTSPKGRRRPFLLAGSVMVPVVLILLFTNYNGMFSGSALMIPYLIINILFWISHGLIYIPFMALGSEITSDYDERTKLRSLSSGIGIVGSYLSTAAPLLLIGFLNARGFNDSQAWFGVGIMAGVCSGLSLFIGWKLTAGVEKMPENGKFEPMKALKEIPLVLKDYWELLKLKTMRILTVFKIIFNVGNAFFTSAMVFFLTYRLGMDNAEISTIYSIQIFIRVFNVFLIGWIAVKIGKSATLLLTLTISGVTCVLFYLFGISNQISLVIFIVITTAAISSFWQVAGAIFDDVAEVDQFRFGKRRQGSVNSLQSGVGSLATAAIYGGFGIYLEHMHFDAALAVQPESALKALDQLFILSPGVCFLLTCAVLLIYPLNKKRFHSLQSALRLKEQGRDYSMYEEDLKKII